MGLLGWLFLTEKVLDAPPKPETVEGAQQLSDLFTKFCSVVQLGNKVLERVEEVTEKTAAQPEVWDQRCRIKKIISRTKQVASNFEKIVTRWKSLQLSECEDDMDFQPIVLFLNVYSECYA